MVPVRGWPGRRRLTPPLRTLLQSAVGHEYQSKLSKHCSQVDSVRGFGGKFGVQVDRVDQVSERRGNQRPGDRGVRRDGHGSTRCLWLGTAGWAF